MRVRIDPAIVNMTASGMITNHNARPSMMIEATEKTGLSPRTVSAILAGKIPSHRSAEWLWEFAYQQKLFNLDERSL